MSILTAWRRETPAPKTGRHSTAGIIDRLRAELDTTRQQLARYVGLTRCGCPAGRHGEYWVRAPRPVSCPWCEVGRQLARVAEAQATIQRLRGADPLLVPAPADEGGREEAAAEQTAPWDVSALRDEAEQLLLLAPAPGRAVPGKAVDEPEAATSVPLDADDTVTLPVPATPPAQVVHPVGEVLPIPPSEDTRPFVTVGTLADIAGGAA